MKRFVLIICIILFLFSACTSSDLLLPTNFNTSTEDSIQTDPDLVGTDSSNSKKLTPEEALQRVKDFAQDGAKEYELYSGLFPYQDQGEFYAIRSLNSASVEGVCYGLTQFLYFVHPETGEMITLDVMDEEQAIQLAKAAVGDVNYETFYECHLLCPGDPDFPQYPPYYHVQVRAPGEGTLATAGNYYFEASTGTRLADPMTEYKNQQEQTQKDN